MSIFVLIDLMNISNVLSINFKKLLSFQSSEYLPNMLFYAVAKGRHPGIYNTWDECKKQVHGFSGPRYKKFKTKQEAEEFISQNSTVTPKTKVAALNSSPSVKLLHTAANSALKSSMKRRLSSNDLDSESNSKKQKKIGGNFNIDDDGYVEVFTDGACSSNGYGNAKAGIGVYFGVNHPSNISQPVNGRATNNMAEIQAVTVAASQARAAGIKKLKISTDSKFLISCITQWMPKWKRNGWKTANGQPVINKQELIEMENALAPLDVKWNHVRGHVGITGNEMADKLAREGSIRYKSC